MSTYDPTAIEQKWQKYWEENGVHTPDLKKAKNPYYQLVMFPYPSGDKLHIGHWYNFAPADSYGRYQRMLGKDVFEPMGFDSFGLPAENYAIKTGIHPTESIEANTKTMIEQLKKMGCMYDWSRSLKTSDPEYYRWTQWLFLNMFKHDLAYKKIASVNWCPKDQTVLANEQVQDGTCERCGTEVVQKSMPQWFWKITKHAERLLDGLDDLDWPEKTKTMQRNWIGKSQGAEIEFSIEGSDETVPVFTTRPDTIFGATYLVLAPEHPLVQNITAPDHKGAIDAYIKEAHKKTELQRSDLSKTKTGVPTGAYALHPATGKQIPIWIGDYVLMHYGTGAIMAVPAHDERDYAFARQYDLPMVQVVDGSDINQEAHTGDGSLMNSDFLDELAVPEAKKKIIAWLENEDKGRGITTYRLRDWLISRQRYWGAPIPIVYDPEGKPHPIPEEHLPWLLPTDVEFKPTGESPLKQSKELKERTETIFGKGWEPEYDTMDTFVCSSFYYLRYVMEGDPKKFADPTLESKWLPVDCYIGGPEHACMHLIYARFVMQALHDFGVVGQDEPFHKLVHQGLITNEGAKMSKSKGNVVSPDAFVDKYGSDVFRMYLMFMGPFTDGGDWNDKGIKGIDRFVKRLYAYTDTHVKDKGNNIDSALHKAIKKVREDLESMQFNTAISALMELLNTIEKQDVSRDDAKKIVQLIAPLAPHLAEELWNILGEEKSIFQSSFPSFDASLLQEKEQTIVVQVNGKVRGQIQIASDEEKESVLAKAKAEPSVDKYLSGASIEKEIYVPGRLVSFVISQ